MRIVFSTTLIASSDPGTSRMGPSGVSFNGAPIVQVEELFRAVASTVYHRGDGPEELAFSVWAGPFVSEAEVLAFMLLHRRTLPGQADLVVSDDSQSVQFRMVGAVRTVSFPEQVGLSIRVDYKFTGPSFSSEAVSPPPADSNSVKAKEIALSINDETVVCVFDSPFTSKPRNVRCDISAPDSGVAIFAIPRESTRTASGVTFDLTQKIPAAGYVALVCAIL